MGATTASKGEKNGSRPRIDYHGVEWAITDLQNARKNLPRMAPESKMLTRIIASLRGKEQRMLRRETTSGRICP